MWICPECSGPMEKKTPPACGNCGWQGKDDEGILDFLSRRDFEDPVLGSYLKNYDVIAQDDLVKPIQSELYVEKQAENFVNMIRGLEGAHVADVGSGKGYLTRALLAHGAGKVTPVDITVFYLRNFPGDGRVQPVRANSERLPFAHEFDIIVSTDVMEHVLNVGSFLFCANRALKPGGRLFVRVPYRERLLAYSPHLGCKYDFVHLRAFDKAILKDNLKDAGFTPRRWRKGGFLPSMPRYFWNSNKYTEYTYMQIRKVLGRVLEHQENTSSWNPLLAGLLMRPIVISVEAVKTRELAK
jgi:SAM-dependent methyltransferase